ncbi:hypothetical protein [Bradyrhizobium uaiense]|uniref:DUF1488 domain-containing protein n=1 Tax=Bradyrhizobium uaiense TaxID=2594946 RepID=A0A6P1BS65_9BRAD|nr:hypothetical protein [Bradyrhizobium uaiense]NEV00511.1 hypothetical protein [Bradyrhizobium uaiense]
MIASRVYIVETAESQRFAFEARNRDDAEGMTRAAWFTRALEGFCSKRLGAESIDTHLRAATDQEAAAFRERAAEFSDEATGVLVAYLGSDALDCAAPLRSRSIAEEK